MDNYSLRSDKLIINLTKLSKEEHFSFTIDEWKSIDTVTGEAEFLEPIKVDFDIKKNPEGFTIFGKVKTKLNMTCARCLDKFEMDINGNIEGIYVYSHLERKYYSSDKLNTLDNIIFFNSEIIDLTDRIIEAIETEIPEVPLCKPDCKGLCPHCGINLNEHPNHKCEEIPNDSPFSVLLDYFKD